MSNELRLMTEPDFSRKSTEPCVFSEETKPDVYAKLVYLKNHLLDCVEYQKTLTMNKAVEKLEYGVSRPKANGKGVNRCLNSRMWSTLIAHISLMESEVKRLTTIYNA